MIFSGAGHTGHILHESVALLVSQFEKVVDMLVVGHEATAVIGLLFEEEYSRHIEFGYFNHKIVKSLIVGAIKTVLGITFHFLLVFSWLIDSIAKLSQKNVTSNLEVLKLMSFISLFCVSVLILGIYNVYLQHIIGIERW